MEAAAPDHNRRKAASLGVNRIQLAAAAFIVYLVGGPPSGQLTRIEAQQQRDSAPSASSTDSAHTGYAGSESCKRCHLKIYSTFARTRMGRSLFPVTPELVNSLSLPASVESSALNRRFETFAHDGKLFQSESQAGDDGADVFRNSKEIGWIIGAGQNGFGGLLARSDFLFEAPLSYYSKSKTWELSPGYETSDWGFNRPVRAGCLFCHTGRPIPVDRSTGRFGDHKTDLTSIGCENCHGPGAAHVQAMSVKGSKLRGSLITDPDSLGPGLENDLCMSCHENGDSRILKSGKSYNDFLPGTPLENTLSILMVPRKREQQDDSDHVQHFYAMSMSRCYLGSKGQLRCTTCHDPHIEPTADEAPGYFNKKCNECHAKQICSLPVAERRRTSPADNCIGCHMAKRNTPEFVHTSLTNHRILRRAGEPWPEAAYHQTTEALPDLFHLNPVPGQADNVSQLTLLDAYSDLSSTSPEYRASYLRVLSGLEKSDPEHASVQLALCRRELDSEAYSEAIDHCRRSLALDLNQAAAYECLSEGFAKLGEQTEAISASEKAVALEPYNSFYRKLLIYRLVTAQQYVRAKSETEAGVKEFPEDSVLRKMLAIANRQ